MTESGIFPVPQVQPVNLMDADLIQFNSHPQYILPPDSLPSSPAFHPTYPQNFAYSPSQIKFMHPQGPIYQNSTYIRPEFVPGNSVQHNRPASIRLHSLSESDSLLESSIDTPRSSPLKRSSSSFVIPTGTQLAPFKERLQRMSAIVDQEIKFMDQNRSDTDNLSGKIINGFEKLSLNTVQEIKGGDITDLLKFCLRIPLQVNSVLTARQKKQLEHLKSALFKECGFDFRVTIIPLLCYHHKTAILTFPRGSLSRRSATMVVLLEVQNKKQNTIIIDSDSRVYQNFQDWQKNNTLPPATLYGPLKSKSQNSQNLITIRMFKTPSCQARKIAIHAVDIIIGVGAVSAGVACLISTGGFALIPASLLAGEIAASFYMGIRGTMSLHDKRKHRPKRR